MPHERSLFKTLFAALRHFGDHGISTNNAKGALDEHNRKTILVPAKRLDDVITGMVEPIAAKIDVQGAEPFVIAGGRNTLSQASLLSVEFWPYSMRRMGGDISALIAFLVEHRQEGSISPGDKDKQAMWQPIVSVATFLHEFAKKKQQGRLSGLTVRKA
jgi:hypothetical protein